MRMRETQRTFCCSRVIYGNLGNFCVRKSDLPTHPSLHWRQSVLRSLRGRGRGLAFGTVGPQSSCGAFVADLIRGTLAPVPGVSAQNIHECVAGVSLPKFQAQPHRQFSNTLQNGQALDALRWKTLSTGVGRLKTAGDIKGSGWAPRQKKLIDDSSLSEY